MVIGRKHSQQQNEYIPERLSYSQCEFLFLCGYSLSGQAPVYRESKPDEGNRECEAKWLIVIQTLSSIPSDSKLMILQSSPLHI
jgi:hypothetical protein